MNAPISLIFRRGLGLRSHVLCHRPLVRGVRDREADRALAAAKHTRPEVPFVEAETAAVPARPQRAWNEGRFRVALDDVGDRRKVRRRDLDDAARRRRAIGDALVVRGGRGGGGEKRGGIAREGEREKDVACERERGQV